MLIKIRPLYKERMRQDQAHTRAHDTYGTITQHLSFQKQNKQSYSLSIFCVPTQHQAIFCTRVRLHISPVITWKPYFLMLSMKVL